jgi:hypothetical protein
VTKQASFGDTQLLASELNRAAICQGQQRLRRTLAQSHKISQHPYRVVSGITARQRLQEAINIDLATGTQTPTLEQFGCLTLNLIRPIG